MSLSDEAQRRLVWADEEVRDALLVDDNFQPLVEVLKSHRCPGGFDRLDLMGAMTLEHEMVCRETPISSAVSPAS